MSNIEDLRANNINSEEKETVNDKRVNISSVANTKRQAPRTVSNVTSADHRVVLDMTQLGEPDPLPDNINIQQDLASEILEGENSIFEKYRKDKKAEMEEMAAQKLQEIENSELESDDDEIEYQEPEEKEEVYVDSMEEDTPEDITMTNEDIENYDIDDLLEEDESIDSDDVESEDDVLVEEKPEAETVVVEEPDKKEKEDNLDIDDSDLDIELASADLDLNIVDEEEESDTDDDRDAILENLKRLATEKLKPASKKLDISSFTVLKKPSSNTKLFKEQQVKAAKWVLPGQDNVVLMKEFLGSELEDLREYSEDPSSLESLSKRYHLIYDHIVSSKPATFEAWIKSVPFSDVQHYIFAIYIASFKGANYLPAECTNTKCKETFLTDNINIMNMVKFDNEEEKNKFTELYNSQPKMTSKAGLYNTEIVPLSDKLAVSFKVPTIYSLFEIASLSDQAKNKFSSILEYVPYIDNVYMIDIENQSLTPCGFKVYKSNMTRTVISKLNMINKMFKTLTIDEYSPIRSYVSEIDKRALDISYIFPEITCPKCGTKIEEQPATSEDLVFTRYQLGALVNTPLK